MKKLIIILLLMTRILISGDLDMDKDYELLDSAESKIGSEIYKIGFALKKRLSEEIAKKKEKYTEWYVKAVESFNPLDHQAVFEFVVLYDARDKIENLQIILKSKDVDINKNFSFDFLANETPIYIAFASLDSRLFEFLYKNKAIVSEALQKRVAQELCQLRGEIQEFEKNNPEDIDSIKFNNIKILEFMYDLLCKE